MEQPEGLLHREGGTTETNVRCSTGENISTIWKSGMRASAIYNKVPTLNLVYTTFMAFEKTSETRTEISDRSTMVESG